MDPETLEMVEKLLQQNKYRAGNEFQTGNPFKDYGSYISTIAKRMEEVGVDFSLQQAALKAMNPFRPKVYNPATPFSPPPFAGGIVTDSLDIPQAMVTMPNPADRIDVHKLDYEGNYIKIQNAGPTSITNVRKTRFPGNKTRDQIIKEQNIYPHDNQDNASQYKTVDYSKLSQPGEGKALKRDDIVAGVPREVVDYEALFERKRFGPGFLEGEKGGEHYYPKPSAKFRKTRNMLNDEKAISNPDAYFTSEDFQQGYLADEFGLSVDRYVPFFFEDLRAIGRRVYFRAFLTNFREQIAPEWSQETYYGRIDPVSIYKSTKRSFQIGFKVAAFSPAGFSTMWKKINQLSKMLYPTYSNGVLIKSPVLKVRIGDVMSDGLGGGLPGYISSPLEINYPENSPWEISGQENPNPAPSDIQLGKAPMIAEIALTFQVIHEKNPEIDVNHNFDFYNFRGIGLVDEASEETADSEDQPSPEVEDGTTTDSGLGSTDLAGISSGVA